MTVNIRPRRYAMTLSRDPLWWKILLADNCCQKLPLIKSVFLQAYKKWIEKNGEEPQLPALNYTNEQLFFVSAAQVNYISIKYFSASGYSLFYSCIHVADSTSLVRKTLFPPLFLYIISNSHINHLHPSTIILLSTIFTTLSDNAVRFWPLQKTRLSFSLVQIKISEEFMHLKN